MRHDIYLSISAQFKVDGIGYYFVTEGVNLRLNGMSAGRRCIYHAQITCSHERKLESSRNWCSRHGKGVNIHLELSQFLLDTHTKFLFFVDDKQSKVFEFHRLSDEFVRPHHDINLSFCQVLKQSLRLGWGASAREVVHSHGKILQTLDKGLVMLERQHGGRYHHCHLLAVGSGFEGSTHGNFRLSKAHITTYQTVHGTRTLHVSLHLLRHLELVGRIFVGERTF